MSKKTGPVADLEQQLAAALVRCEELAQEAAGHRDAALRAAADFENYRRRTRQELAESRQRGIEAVICDLVPVLDNFDRALAVAADEDSDGAGSNNAEAVRKGVILMQRQLQSALEKHGLQRYSCVGELFDPHRAEAVGFVADAGQERETVVAEECCGYQCADRVVRPARVVVARPPLDEQMK